MIGLGLGVVWWFYTIKAKEQASELARRYCKQQGWQLLDATVALSRAWPTQTAKGWRFKRRYRFEFSADGGDRHRAWLVLVDGQAPLIETPLDQAP